MFTTAVCSHPLQPRHSPTTTMTTNTSTLEGTSFSDSCTNDLYDPFDGADDDDSNNDNDNDTGHNDDTGGIIMLDDEDFFFEMDPCMLDDEDFFFEMDPRRTLQRFYSLEQEEEDASTTNMSRTTTEDGDDWTVNSKLMREAAQRIAGKGVVVKTLKNHQDQVKKSSYDNCSDNDETDSSSSIVSSLDADVDYPVGDVSIGCYDDDYKVDFIPLADIIPVDDDDDDDDDDDVKVVQEQTKEKPSADNTPSPKETNKRRVAQFKRRFSLVYRCLLPSSNARPMITSK